MKIQNPSLPQDQSILNKIKYQKGFLGMRGRKSRFNQVMSQTRLNDLIEKSISDTNVISKSLPDKEFIKFWRMMQSSYGSYVNDSKLIKIKILSLYQKVKLLKYMTKVQYANESEIPVFSKHFKYNLYFESFIVKPPVDLNSLPEVLNSPVLTSFKNNKISTSN
jgi:hypothetical protein